MSKVGVLVSSIEYAEEPFHSFLATSIIFEDNDDKTALDHSTPSPLLRPVTRSPKPVIHQHCQNDTGSAVSGCCRPYFVR